MNGDIDYKLPIPTKEAFEKGNADAKFSFLYDMQKVALENQAEIVKVLVKRKRVDTTVAGALGLVGGFISAFLTKVFRF